MPKPWRPALFEKGKPLAPRLEPAATRRIDDELVMDRSQTARSNYRKLRVKLVETLNRRVVTICRQGSYNETHLSWVVFPERRTNVARDSGK
jgi:hypothetical protein